MGQDSIQITPPKIITKLKTGTSFTLDKKAVKFIKVVEDSRCPSDVTCFWAGQATVLIGLYENDDLLEEKEIIIGAKGISPKNIKELITSHNKTIFGYNLIPYPSSDQKINPSDYYLELLVK